MQTNEKYLPSQFDLEDEGWLNYLDLNGYVVIKQVANISEVESAVSLFWDHFESRKGVNILIKLRYA